MDFSKVILMTDLDGTLLTDDKRLLDCDLAAIERFRKGGGLFTIATGRGYAMAKPVSDALGLDCPAVVYNGAAVYDFRQEKFLWQCSLQGNAPNIIKAMAKRYPDIGVEVLRGNVVHVPYLNEMEQWHLNLENVHADFTPLDEIPADGWLKVLFAYPPEKLDELERYVESGFGGDENFGSVHWVRSAPMFYECLPIGIDKAAGYKQLIKAVGAEDRFTVAAGDFMNDLAMVQSADLGAAPSSAQPSVKSAADIVLCDNNSGAMAQLIEYIEKM